MEKTECIELTKETITEAGIRAFEDALYECEKAKATITKYTGAIRELGDYLSGEPLTKKRLLCYRDMLLEKSKVQTVNGAISAINAYLTFTKKKNMQLRLLKVQKRAFLEENRELTEHEYKRLLETAQNSGQERLYMLMLTLGSTGIRISELPYITAEAVKNGRAEIYLKGKCRTVLLPKALRRKLLQYQEQNGIKSGAIFRTKGNKPMDRSNICHAMKRLSRMACVDENKVFPHNFRHLFARMFFAVEKNLGHLADVLGHSRMETTRIYVATRASEHEKILDKMRLIV